MCGEIVAEFCKLLGARVLQVEMSDGVPSRVLCATRRGGEWVQLQDACVGELVPVDVSARGAFEYCAYTAFRTRDGFVFVSQAKMRQLAYAATARPYGGSYWTMPLLETLYVPIAELKAVSVCAEDGRQLPSMFDVGPAAHHAGCGAAVSHARMARAESCDSASKCAAGTPVCEQRISALARLHHETTAQFAVGMHALARGLSNLALQTQACAARRQSEQHAQACAALHRQSLLAAQLDAAKLRATNLALSVQLAHVRAQQATAAVAARIARAL